MTGRWRRRILPVCLGMDSNSQSVCTRPMTPVCGVHMAGKYQNVLRECGQPVAQPTLPQSAAAAAAGAPPSPLPPLAYSPAHPAALAQHVKAAHAAASSALLTFVLRGGGGAGAAAGGVRTLGGAGGLGGGGGGGGAGLVAVLRSMKHFFLLDQVGACVLVVRLVL